MLPTWQNHDRESLSSLTGQAKKQSGPDGSSSGGRSDTAKSAIARMLSIPLVGEPARRKEVWERISSGVSYQKTRRWACLSASSAWTRTRRSIRGSFTIGAARGWSWRQSPKVEGAPSFVGALVRIQRRLYPVSVPICLLACLLLSRAPSPLAVGFVLPGYTPGERGSRCLPDTRRCDRRTCVQDVGRQPEVVIPALQQWWRAGSQSRPW